jgi:hypothetical protein
VIALSIFLSLKRDRFLLFAKPRSLKSRIVRTNILAFEVLGFLVNLIYKIGDGTTKAAISLETHIQQVILNIFFLT